MEYVSFANTLLPPLQGYFYPPACKHSLLLRSSKNNQFTHKDTYAEQPIHLKSKHLVPSPYLLPGKNFLLTEIHI